MKSKKHVFTALGLAVLLFTTSVLTPMVKVEASARRVISKIYGVTEKLTDIGYQTYDFMSTTNWRNDCKSWMTSTGEQLDVMEDKVDGLTESVQDMKKTLADIQIQITGVSTQMKEMTTEITGKITASDLKARLETVDKLVLETQQLYDELDKISAEGISQTERAQRVAIFINHMENGDGFEKLFNDALAGLTKPNVSGKSITETYLDYLKVDNPFYFEIYDDQVRCYQTFSDIITTSSYLLTEYYHYYSGPYNPRSRFITINQKDLNDKVVKGLEDIYSQLDINDNDAPRHLATVSGNESYSGHGQFIQDGIFKDVNISRVRSTVSGKSYMITVGNSTRIPKWNQIYNLSKTPYGPKDEYMAGSTVTDAPLESGGKTYNMAKNSNEVTDLLKYYSDYSMNVSKYNGSLYDFLFTEHTILLPKTNEIRKNGTVGEPLSADLYIPIALQHFAEDGQYYIETTTSDNPEKKLTYTEAQNNRYILDSNYGDLGISNKNVFHYVFVENTDGGKSE